MRLIWLLFSVVAFGLVLVFLLLLGDQAKKESPEGEFFPPNLLVMEGISIVERENGKKKVEIEAEKAVYNEKSQEYDTKGLFKTLSEHIKNSRKQ